MEILESNIIDDDQFGIHGRFSQETMPGLTLLNIDRERDQETGDPYNEILGIIDNIKDFSKGLDSESPKPRLVPLRIKLRTLQDAVSQFGSDGTIPVNQKQKAIMDLHPELMMLGNELGMIHDDFLKDTEICMNFLLNHLCSTATSDAKSQIIGVSNVMAQVLSSNMKIIEYPEFTTHPSDPNYFFEFARIFNSMLTTAGLFSAPVLGLPDIPISALGGWADQALEQFAIINKFVKRHFDTTNFYHIDKLKNAQPFDTTTDILSFYVYENEFLSALLARADLLSGLEFKITEDNIPVRLQSVEKITHLIAQTIDSNCKQLEEFLDSIDLMYANGVIDRNEKPSEHPHLMAFRTESRIWKQIAEFARVMTSIFEEHKKNTEKEYLLHVSILNNVGSQLPPLDEQPANLQLSLHTILEHLLDSLFEKFPNARIDKEQFIRSSDFTEFKEFMQYAIIIVAANDILLRSNTSWTPWFLKNYGDYFIASALEFNPIGAMQIAVMLPVVGLINQSREYVEQGLDLLRQLKPHMDFQLHHLAAIEVLNLLLTNPYSEYHNLVEIISDNLMAFLQEFEVNPNSMLFQKVNLYLAMLLMYEESAGLPENRGIYRFLRKEDERFVTFDPFSWLQVPRNFKPDFPYIPMNTVLDNLNAG